MLSLLSNKIRDTTCYQQKLANLVSVNRSYCRGCSHRSTTWWCLRLQTAETGSSYQSLKYVVVPSLSVSGFKLASVILSTQPKHLLLHSASIIHCTLLPHDATSRLVSLTFKSLEKCRRIWVRRL